MFETNNFKPGQSVFFKGTKIIAGIDKPIEVSGLWRIKYINVKVYVEKMEFGYYIEHEENPAIVKYVTEGELLQFNFISANPNSIQVN